MLLTYHINVLFPHNLPTFFSSSRKGSSQRIFKNMNEVYYRLPGQYPVTERFERFWKWFVWMWVSMSDFVVWKRIFVFAHILLVCIRQFSKSRGMAYLDRNSRRNKVCLILFRKLQILSIMTKFIFFFNMVY